MEKPGNSGLSVSAGGDFCLNTWRRLIDRAAKQLHPEHQAICPFGFELFDDSEPMLSTVDRYYILLYTRSTAAMIQDGNDYTWQLKLLMEAEQPAFCRQVCLWRANRQDIISVPPEKITGPAKMINVLVRPTREQPLTDYAHYVICCATAIEQGTLGEYSAYFTSLRARRRLKQIVLMLNQLINRCLDSEVASPEPSWSEYKDEISRHLQGIYNAPLTAAEQDFIRTEAKQTAQMFMRLSQAPASLADDVISIKAVDYYSGKPLSTQLRLSHYTRLTTFITETYNHFGQPQSV